jgi:hypothetical protein
MYSLGDHVLQLLLLYSRLRKRLLCSTCHLSLQVANGVCLLRYLALELSDLYCQCVYKAM